MKLAPIMSANASAFAFRVDDLPSLTDFCRRFGQRIIAVDGFAGVGKTTLAQGLARELGTTLVSLDDYLPGDPEAMNVQSYVSPWIAIDSDALSPALLMPLSRARFCATQSTAWWRARKWQRYTLRSAAILCLTKSFGMTVSALRKVTKTGPTGLRGRKRRITVECARTMTQTLSRSGSSERRSLG